MIREYHGRVDLPERLLVICPACLADLPPSVLVTTTPQAEKLIRDRLYLHEGKCSYRSTL